MTKCKYCSKEHENNNTGCRNSGYRNSGNFNSEDFNSGNYNSGYRNSGNYNSGYCNSGDYNSGNYNSGWFNTNEPKMRFFNKDSDITYSEFVEGNVVYPNLKICSWVSEKDLPVDEVTAEVKQMGGKLKTLEYKEAWAEYWQRANEADKEWFKNLPNFDAKIFAEITGIYVSATTDMSDEELIKELERRGKVQEGKIIK